LEAVLDLGLLFFFGFERLDKFASAREISSSSLCWFSKYWLMNSERRSRRASGANLR
jgi:hypothetical protein